MLDNRPIAESRNHKGADYKHKLNESGQTICTFCDKPLDNHPRCISCTALIHREHTKYRCGCGEHDDLVIQDNKCGMCKDRKPVKFINPGAIDPVKQQKIKEDGKLRKCDECGKPFRMKSHNARYCPPEDGKRKSTCSHRAEKKRRHDKNPKRCLECGKILGLKHIHRSYCPPKDGKARSTCWYRAEHRRAKERDMVLQGGNHD